MQYESTSLQLELARNASTQTHKLLMNYLSNSTGIYIRLRQHPRLKSSPPQPGIPKEAVTEVKFLYVNTGNAEQPAFSAIVSVLAGSGLCWQTNGACSCHITADKCQFAGSSPTFLHLCEHNHTTTTFLSLFQHPHATLPCSPSSWICPPCAKSHLLIPL